ncbi:MAG: 30S ribosomal protein S3 [Candidatus Vogelbacteria bacterium]|nr:30S ribosomal protein S3 [Candidatus Vogelbacteria bacterium]
MSHSVHPYSHRLGIIRDWKSRWFGVPGKYQQFLKSDVTIREFLDKRLHGHYVGGIEIERGSNSLKIIIKTSRPGMIIGRSGEGTTKIKDEIVKKLKRLKISVPKDVKIEIEEIRFPETSASIVGQMCAEGLEKRLPFMRVMKQAVEKTMANREAKGVKITMSGRLGGAEMSRVETVKNGRLPLQTLRADVDFAREKAHLPYGDIGIKVWIYKGEIFEKAKK